MKVRYCLTRHHNVEGNLPLTVSVVTDVINVALSSMLPYAELLGQELLQLFKDLNVPCLSEVLAEEPLPGTDAGFEHGAIMIMILMTCSRYWIPQHFSSYRIEQEQRPKFLCLPLHYMHPLGGVL